MNHYLSLHLDSLRRAVSDFFRQPLGNLLILLMLAVSMTLPLALYLGLQSSKTVLDKLSEVPQITLYMETVATESDYERVRQLLKADPRVESIRFIGKDEGLSEMQQAMGEQNIIHMLDENPLPDSFVVTPKENNPDVIGNLQRELAAYPMVESSALDKEWMQTLYQFNKLLGNVFWFLAITFALTFLLVVHNTVRLQILSHKAEIEITRLLGAPSSFVRRPFLYQATLQSLVAGLVSMILCHQLMLRVQQQVGDVFKPYGLYLQWRGFHSWEMMAVIAIVVSLGAVGAWFAVGRYLKGFAGNHR